MHQGNFPRSSSYLSLVYRLHLSTIVIVVGFLAVFSACSLPWSPPQPTPSPTAKQPTAESELSVTPTPTPTQQPLPPALIESDPPSQAEIGLHGEITLYFNQAMDHPSVEAAFEGINGTFKWEDDSTVSFTPREAYAVASEINLRFDQTTQSSKGLPLAQAVNLTYLTPDYLSLIQRIPEPRSRGINPASAIIASFNNPVIPLGADPKTLPKGFELRPDVDGMGEWVNTSTYVFYPKPALAGGVEYIVQVNQNLTSLSASPQQKADIWSFSTELPQLLSIQPIDGSKGVGLDFPITLEFNQPIDPESFADHFSLLDSVGGSISGTTEWNDEKTIANFTPSGLLKRDRVYRVLLGGQTLSGGGTPLGKDIEISFRTVPPLSVLSPKPFEQTPMLNYGSIRIDFNAPIKAKNILQFITFTPEVQNLDPAFITDRSLILYGSYAPDTDYQMIISPNLQEIWNGRLSQEYILNFHTPSLTPALYFTLYSDVLFVNASNSSITAQAVNLDQVTITLGMVPVEDFMRMIPPGGYEYIQEYDPQIQRTYVHELDTPRNESTSVTLPLSLNGGPLMPGYYLLRLHSKSAKISEGPYLLMVSNINLTMKLSPTGVLIWAVDLVKGDPISQVPLMVYSEDGTVLTSGKTNTNGIFQSDISPLKNPYEETYTILGDPGDETFGSALSTWTLGVSGSDFGLPTHLLPPHLQAYIYTDRPIYRPGQTVNFRAVARQTYNGRYTSPDTSNLNIKLKNEAWEDVSTFDLPLSIFGTAHGSYQLPENLTPGTYQLYCEAANYSTVTFQVAEYRKPEIDLTISFPDKEVLFRSDITGTVTARYYFDAPVGNIPINWTVYRSIDSFDLPGYEVGTPDYRWLSITPWANPSSLGVPVNQGEGKTDQYGNFNITFTPKEQDNRYAYTLVATATDESGLPVSARSGIVVNPANYFIGIERETWVGQAGEESGFGILVVDPESNPAGSHELIAEFNQVAWEEVDPTPGMGQFSPALVPQYTSVAKTKVETSLAGTARVVFTPPEPGTYQISLKGNDIPGQGAVTEILWWVSGPGEIIWPNLPEQRLRLTADKPSYQIGETAQIFVPNPFAGETLALITIERGIVITSQTLKIEGSIFIPVEIDESAPPNVYVSVTLLRTVPNSPVEFRQGYMLLPVEPLAQTLQVDLTSTPEKAEPGGNVALDIRVTDVSNKPVEGQFSLSVVDKALLALADPNSPGIVEAFYGQQPLGVITSLSLAASTDRYLPASSEMAYGGGGGGDENAGLFSATPIRQNFLDTAFWNADLITDQNGQAQVNLTLPDNLTTWQVNVQGITQDSLVGENTRGVVSTKDLLIRPVTPRFLVLGDHALFAAVVHNNTEQNLQAEVTLQSPGFSLDQPEMISQSVNLPPKERVRVEWWGTAEDVESIDPVFSVNAGSLQDASRPNMGALPVLRYSAQQTFSTAGVLDEPGSKLEMVSLPHSFDPSGGNLIVEATPSLGGAMIDVLEVLQSYPYACTELTVSRFLPNLETYRVFQEFDIHNPAMQSQLDQTLDDSLNLLVNAQNEDGGWSWVDNETSDSYISAYVLLGLLRAVQAGFEVPQKTLAAAASYILQASLLVTPDSETWQLDRQAFQSYVLSQAGRDQSVAADQLFNVRERLNPWAQALLALIYEEQSPDSQFAQTLFSELGASANRSATGVHWENHTPSYENMSDTIQATATVLYALAQQDPNSPLVADALRYLMDHRNGDGAWNSSYESAWTLMALAEVMSGTKELGGEFEYRATLNNVQIMNVQASEETQLTPLTSSVPIEELLPTSPNALSIERSAGSGRLYYTAQLQVSQPVDEVAPLNKGVSIERIYLTDPQKCSQDGCSPISSAHSGDIVTVRLTVNVPESMYYLMVEDYIPAGSEVLDASLKTSQPGETPPYNPLHPFDEGWGWWYFSLPRIYDDHITWSAQTLPPGTYEFTYQLVILQPGEYRVLPARAWQFYFPEVQGVSAGKIFTIE